jgi:hypothetical protein
MDISLSGSESPIRRWDLGGLILDHALSGSCVREAAAKPSEPVLADTELVTYRVGFIRRRAQTDVGDIFKIAMCEHLNDEPYTDR